MSMLVGLSGKSPSTLEELLGRDLAARLDRLAGELTKIASPFERRFITNRNLFCLKEFRAQVRIKLCGVARTPLMDFCPQNDQLVVPRLQQIQIPAGIFCVRGFT